jgi:hypothetical protein
MSNITEISQLTQDWNHPILGAPSAMLLCGSRARGTTWRYSDLDILYVYDESFCSFHEFGNFVAGGVFVNLKHATLPALIDNVRHPERWLSSSMVDTLADARILIDTTSGMADCIERLTSITRRASWRLARSLRFLELGIVLLSNYADHPAFNSAVLRRVVNYFALSVIARLGGIICSYRRYPEQLGVACEFMKVPDLWRLFVAINSLDHPEVLRSTEELDRFRLMVHAYQSSLHEVVGHIVLSHKNKSGLFRRLVRIGEKLHRLELLLSQAIDAGYYLGGCYFWNMEIIEDIIPSLDRAWCARALCPDCRNYYAMQRSMLLASCSRMSDPCGMREMAVEALWKCARALLANRDVGSVVLSCCLT